MRNRALLGMGCVLLAAHVVACGGGDTTSGEVQGTRISTEAVRASCRVVCATCAPGTACPDLCRLECPRNVVPCGDHVCRNGDVCCNESCGICTPPDGSCTQQICVRKHTCVETALCIRGFHFSQTECACVPDVPGICTTDADCRLVADFCTGCDCRALSTHDPDPVCAGPGVRCFADPCLNQSASCVDGQCMVAPFCVDTQLCIRGSHWSPTLCRCVPDRPHAPHTPHAPHRPHPPHVP